MEFRSPTFSWHRLACKMPFMEFPHLFLLDSKWGISGFYTSYSWGCTPPRHSLSFPPQQRRSRECWQQRITRPSFTRVLPLVEYPQISPGTFRDFTWVASGFETSCSWEDAHPNMLPWQQVERCRRRPSLTTNSAFPCSSTVGANVGSSASCGRNHTKHPTKDLHRYLQCLASTPLRIKANPTKDLNTNPNGLEQNPLRLCHN